MFLNVTKGRTNKTARVVLAVRSSKVVRWSLERQDRAGAWWYTPGISAPERLRHGDLEFKASLDYTRGNHLTSGKTKQEHAEKTLLYLASSL